MSHADTYGEGGCATESEVMNERRKDAIAEMRANNREGRKEYCVNAWGSHPDNLNDDCYYGDDFDTFEEALADFKEDCNDTGVQFIELDGPGVYMIRENPNYKPSKDDDSDWRREMAMEAGMCMGVDAYNEVMGYD